MLNRKTSAVFLASAIDACALWRCYIPHLNTPGSTFFCFQNRPPDFNLITGNDVVVMQRCCTIPQFNFIRTVKQLGIGVIHDLDDDVWDLPDENPAKSILRQVREGFAACMSLTDVLTVSTKPLAKVAEKQVRPMLRAAGKPDIPIVVVENRIDPLYFVPAGKKPDRIIVGWQGSSSHIGDLKILQPVIEKLSVEYPSAEFQFRGCEPPKDLYKLHNVTHKLWMPVAEFAARMPLWGWSIALAPVTDHEFNKSKSPIKMVESGFCNIPCLASYLEPYDRFVSYDPELRWLLCAGANSWEPKIRELINDEAKRDDLGKRCRKVVDEHYSFNKPHEQWLQAFEIAKLAKAN